MLSKLQVPEKVRKALSDRARWEDLPPTGVVSVGSIDGRCEMSSLTSISWLPWNETRRPLSRS